MTAYEHAGLDVGGHGHAAGASSFLADDRTEVERLEGRGGPVVMTGVIIAGLGVLNDVTITQASAVWELHESSPTMGPARLFARAMRIGRDHIASTVYTIAFATAGAALPVLLLIYLYEQPLLNVLQSEAISEEIIRTLVGSIGLVLAVPLTTAIGVAVTRRAGPNARRPAGRRRADRSADQFADGDW